MQIETTRFGTLELDETTFIHFPWGIPGFEELKRYVLLEHRDGPFKWLQAVDEPSVAFVVCPPERVGARYTIPEEKRTPLGLQSEEDLAILIMVSFDHAEKNLRLHLRGPLLFNASNRQAYQWTIDSSELDRFVQQAQP